MSQESFIYSFVARGIMILAEYTEFTGNFPAIAAQCLQRLPSTNNKFTYNCDHHTFNFLVEDGYAYCVVAKDSVGKQISIAFLERVKADFRKRYGGGKADTAIAKSLNKEFGPIMKEHMKYIIDHAEEIEKLLKVKAQVSEVKSIMLENIDKDMDKSWISLPRYHRKYAEGVWDFMQYAQGNADGSGMFYCPCKMCKCRSDMHRFPLGTVWDHLKSNGFWERYTCWIYHGETSSRPHDHGQFDETGSTSNDPTTTFINDMFPHDSGVCPERQHIPQAPMQAVPGGVNTAGIAKYNRLIAFQQTPLCPGHEKTVLQCVMEVMHIKVDTKSTVTAVDRYLQYAASLLPDGHRHPTTHHKVRRILRDLGLSYIKIHACRYDCVLFWGKDADGNDLEGLHRCPVCGTDRYKRTPAGNRKPVKVLRYFPLRDRLERLYMSSKMAEAMRWHAVREVHDEDLMVHPMIFTVQYLLQMDMIKSDDNPNWSHELLLLAMQPQRARVYPTCTVNGVKFVSEERDSRRRTQNSGVMAKGHGLDYYGVLHSVVELVYAEGMKVHLFKCRWFDTGAQSMKMDQYGNLSVNTATSAYEDDPFVFATSVKQVFYLDDLARGDAWKIANIVHPRNIYRAATLGVTIPGPEADAYQEPNAVGIHDVATVRQNNVKHGRVLRIRDEDSTFIDVDPNEETDDDSDDELRHRLPDINSDTEEDSSDDSDYEP